jgi:rubrerythrin
MTDFDQAVRVLDTTISFEAEGLNFFTEQSTRAPTRFEREIFLALAKDELGHKTYLEKLREDLVQTHDLDTIEDEGHDQWSARKVFAAALDRAIDPYTPRSAELEALRSGMELKRRGYAMYREAIDKMETRKACELFEHLAEEEKVHFQLLRNTYDYLDDPEQWHGFDEGPLLDGG